MRETNELIKDGKGSPYTLKTYDRYERVIEIRYFNSDGTAGTGPEGCSRVAMDYTSRGQVSLIRYYDEQGKATTVDGVYGISSEYNGYGNLQLKTWLNQDGSPMLNQDGYASSFYDYDLSNSESVEYYYEYYQAVDGTQKAAKNGAWGVNTIYYPATHVHEIIYVDKDGEPMMTSDGYSIYEYETDDNENVTWDPYFDTMEAPVNGKDGYSSVEKGYDEAGRLVSERYLDRYNRLTNNKDGIAGWNGYYDENGKLVITNRYDQDRNPVSEN